MCEMVSCNVLNDVSKCYYVAEMDENKYQYQYEEYEGMEAGLHALLTSAISMAEFYATQVSRLTLL
jgi:hypothetical protein